MAGKGQIGHVAEKYSLMCPRLIRCCLPFRQLLLPGEESFSRLISFVFCALSFPPWGSVGKNVGTLQDTLEKCRIFLDIPLRPVPLSA